MSKEQENNIYVDKMLFSYLEGTASIDEQEWIKNWLQEDANHLKELEEFKVMYHWFRKGNSAGGTNKEESWNRIKAGYYKSGFLTAIQHKKTGIRISIFRLAMAAAAAVILAFVVGFYVNALYFNESITPGRVVYNEVYVPLGSRSQITLSDGTRVWLNAGSKMRYPMNFSSTSREVILEGEAYFDVAKMRDKIFIVKTSDVNVKVYGTQFNIKAYADESIIQTTLVEGSLSVEPSKNSILKKAVMLKPYQSASYYKSKKGGEKSEKQLMVTPTADPLTVTSWKDSKWIITGEELDELAIKLERRYNVKITFEDESLKNYKFSGTLKEETFEQVLKIVQLSMPIVYTVEENNVIFREDTSFKKKYDTMIKTPDLQNAN